MKKYLLMLLAALLVTCGFVYAFSGSAQAQQDTIRLRYDDRKELSSLVDATGAVEITDEVVTSCKVGTQTPDDHVLVYQDGVVYAVGTGSATLTVDGTAYSVIVEPAPISLFMITGHSVGIGEQGDAAQSVAIEAGQAYSTHRYWTYSNCNKCELVIDPQEVTPTTGLGYAAENRISGIDAFAPGGGGTLGGSSGLAWQWNQLTGEKVWVINAARGGSCLNHWVPDAEGPAPTKYKYLYNSSMEAYRNAQYILKNEIAAGHYTLSHMGMIYHNGANFSHFSGWTYSDLQAYYDLMWNSFKTDLTTDMDGDGVAETLEFLGLVPTWGGSTTSVSYSHDKSVAYYMAASQDYPYAFLACDITRYYKTKASLANFPEITYTTQSKPVSRPESVLSIKNGGSSDNSFFCLADYGHLSQVAYNAQGIEMADNVYGYLFNNKEATVELRDGSNNILPDSMDLRVAQTIMVVPMLDPEWSAGDLEFSATGAIRIEYPCIVEGVEVGTGTLSVSRGDKVLKQINFNVTAGHTHCFCVGAETLPEGHTCHESLWQSVDSNPVSITEDGYYYLDWMDSKASSIRVADGVNAYICLNGANIYAQQTVQLGKKSSLTICDCSLGGKGTITISAAAKGAPVFLNGQKTITLMSGIISGTISNATFPAVTISSSHSNFYMYGGELVGGLAQKNYDGETDANQTRSDDFGGTVCMIRGHFYQYGGKITGGRSTTYGGAVGLANNATFTMYGGTIEGGTSTTYGGTIGVGASDAVVTIYGGTIKGGTSTTHGSALGMGAGSTTIYGGTIYGGTAKTYGGAMSIMVSGKLYVYGGTIINGAAKQYTNGIYTNRDSITLGGNPTIEEIYLKGTAKLSISTQTPLTAAKSIGINMENKGEFSATTADCATAFVPNVAGYGVGFTGSALKLTTDVAQVGSNTYATFAEAIAAGNEIRLLQDVSEAVTVTDTLYLDLSGCDLSGLTVKGQLYVIDSANNAYAENSCGILECTLGENGSINDGKTVYTDGQIHYVAIQTDGAYSFHRIDAALTHISLDAKKDALGYKAHIYGDSQALQAVDAFGLKLYVSEDNAKTYTKACNSSGLFTLRLNNIMKSSGGETAIYGAPVIVIGEQTIVLETTSTSMRDTIVAVNQLTDLSSTQKLAVYDLYREHSDIMDKWLGENNNIRNWC